MSLTLTPIDYWGLFQTAAPDSINEGNLDWTCTWLASDLGQGYRRELVLREGIDLATEELCFRDDLVVQHCDRIHPLEYSFEWMSQAGKTHKRYNLFGSGLAPKELWRLPGKLQLHTLSVHIEPVLFQQWIGADQALPAALQSLVRSPSETYDQRSGVTTATMQMTMQQILNCPFQGLTQRLYLESKVWELMTLLIEDLFASPSLRTVAYVLKPEDVERIHYASKILQAQLLSPPSLVELARAVGINDHKLKVGFHQVFGTTVFGYLHDRRMDQSRQLLESGDLNVTEAARAVGFTNRGHFAAAFRRKFGINPGIYARQRRA